MKFVFCDWICGLLRLLWVLLMRSLSIEWVDGGIGIENRICWRECGYIYFVCYLCFIWVNVLGVIFELFGWIGCGVRDILWIVGVVNWLDYVLSGWCVILWYVRVMYWGGMEVC